MPQRLRSFDEEISSDLEQSDESRKIESDPNFGIEMITLLISFIATILLFMHDYK
jgi:hypothetical protein